MGLTEKIIDKESKIGVILQLMTIRNNLSKNKTTQAHKQVVSLIAQLQQYKIPHNE